MNCVLTNFKGFGPLEHVVNKEFYDLIKLCVDELELELHTKASCDPLETYAQAVMDRLPSEIKIEAGAWGWDDTVVRDMVYEFIQDTML